MLVDTKIESWSLKMDSMKELPVIKWCWWWGGKPRAATFFFSTNLSLATPCPKRCWSKQQVQNISEVPPARTLHLQDQLHTQEAVHVVQVGDVSWVLLHPWWGFRPDSPWIPSKSNSTTCSGQVFHFFNKYLTPSASACTSGLVFPTPAWTRTLNFQSSLKTKSTMVVCVAIVNSLAVRNPVTVLA